MFLNIYNMCTQNEEPDKTVHVINILLFLFICRRNNCLTDHRVLFAIFAKSR